IEVVGDLVTGHAGAFRRRDRSQGTDSAPELVGGPGQSTIAPALDAGGALLVGQVTDRGLLEERGGQRAEVAEPGGIHRRRDDRLAVGVTAGPGIAFEQVWDTSRVLGTLPFVPGAGGRRCRFG